MAISGPSASTNADWYVIQAKPQQESRAECNLRRQGLRTFLPLTSVAHGGAPRMAPLFPGYLFVNCKIDGYAYQIRNTRGVRGIVGTANGPSRIDEGLVESIRTRVGHDGSVALSGRPRRGSPLRILRGPLAGFDAVFDENTSSLGRIAVLLQMMAREVRVTVDVSHVCGRSLHDGYDSIEH